LDVAGCQRQFRRAKRNKTRQALKKLTDFLVKNVQGDYSGEATKAGWEVYSRMAEVRVQEGEPLENALRRFKRKVQTEDIIKEVKRHSFYLKPGEKKRVKEALARKRNRKKVRKEQD
jgi:small subunit ribosomal protein S21